MAINKTDPVVETRELLSNATPWPWERGEDIECQNESDNCWHVFDKQAEIYPPIGEVGPVATAAQCDYDNASLIARAPELLTALCDEVEALRNALKEIANDPHCAYEMNEGGSYGIGVTDGHRCAAQKAHAALALVNKPDTDSAISDDSPDVQAS